MILSVKEILGLKLRDSSNNIISIFAPSVLIKYGADHDAKVVGLQFVHGRLSARIPHVLQHSPFTNVVVDPWHRRGKVSCIYMDEYSGVRLVKVIDGMSSTELDLSCSSFSRCVRTRE